MEGIKEGKHVHVGGFTSTYTKQSFLISNGIYFIYLCFRCFYVDGVRVVVRGNISRWRFGRLLSCISHTHFMAGDALFLIRFTLNSYSCLILLPFPFLGFGFLFLFISIPLPCSVLVSALFSILVYASCLIFRGFANY